MCTAAAGCAQQHGATYHSGSGSGSLQRGHGMRGGTDCAALAEALLGLLWEIKEDRRAPNSTSAAAEGACLRRPTGTQRDAPAASQPGQFSAAVCVSAPPDWYAAGRAHGKSARPVHALLRCCNPASGRDACAAALTPNRQARDESPAQLPQCTGDPCVDGVVTPPGHGRLAMLTSPLLPLLHRDKTPQAPRVFAQRRCCRCCIATRPQAP